MPSEEAPQAVCSCLYGAVLLLPLSDALVLTSVAPLVVAVLSPILIKESPSRRVIAELQDSQDIPLPSLPPSICHSVQGLCVRLWRLGRKLRGVQRHGSKSGMSVLGLRSPLPPWGPLTKPWPILAVNRVAAFTGLEYKAVS